MKIAVTGASGFVGNKIVQMYEGAIVIPSLKNKTTSEIEKIIKESEADVLIHTAAISDVGTCQARPEESYQANVMLPVTIAKNFEGKKWTDFLLYSFVCYLIPLGISLAFYFTKFFGKNNLYCWIKIEHTQHLIAEITIYGIRYINFFINLLFTFLIIKFVLSHYDDDTSVKEKGIQFIIYPSIQLLGMILPSLNRIFQVFNVTSVLEVPGTISVMLQGLLFPICYGWTSHAFYFLINCCKPVRPDNISDNISDYLTDDSALIDESNY